MEPSQSLTLDQIDLSDFEFWTRPYEEREGAFLTLREEDPIRFFDEPELEMRPARPRLLRAHPPRRRARGEQAPAALLLGARHEHRRHAARTSSSSSGR